jgi:hypothetical protein
MDDPRERKPSNPQRKTQSPTACGGILHPPWYARPLGGPRVSSAAWHRLGCLLRGATRPRLCTPVACTCQVLVCLPRAPPTGGTHSASRTRCPTSGPPQGPLRRANPPARHTACLCCNKPYNVRDFVNCKSVPVYDDLSGVFEVRGTACWE